MSISFKTDQSGAQAQICSGTSSTFNFSVAANSTVTTGVFSMKRGSTSTGSVTAAIHNQPNGGGTVVASVAIPAASFSQTFTDMTFTFPANTQLTSGTAYSLVISSATSCGGSAAYAFKPGSFQVIDDTTNTVINTGYGVDAAMAVVATVAATARAQYKAAAAAAVVAAMAADPSVLQANTVNKWRHDGALTDRIYRGSTRVRKARRGNNIILDQPN